MPPKPIPKRAASPSTPPPPPPPPPPASFVSGESPGQTSVLLQPTPSGGPPPAALQVKFLTGYVAVRMGFCTVRQVKEALEIQKRSVPRPHLGAILVELGYLSARDLTDELLYTLNAVKSGNVTREQAEEAIDVRNRSTPRPPIAEVMASMKLMMPKPVVNPNRFGAVAVRLGLVTTAQIDEAVQIQMRSRPRPFLGAVLVELGYLSPRTLCKVLDAQASSGGWQG